MPFSCAVKLVACLTDDSNRSPCMSKFDNPEIYRSILETMPNKIAIEGHTDSKPYAQQSNSENWELSADRANAARRLMQQHGIREDQVMQVRGFADQRFRKSDAPVDPSNRRVSLIVESLPKRQDPDEPDAGAEKSESQPPGTPPANAFSAEP